MNYQTVILRLLGSRQFIVCHKQLLLHEFDGRDEPRIGLENWCLYHGIELNHINENMVKLSKKNCAMMEFNAYLS